MKDVDSVVPMPDLLATGIISKFPIYERALSREVTAP
jgi:hypothetical protein